jgi:hypothetical protein
MWMRLEGVKMVKCFSVSVLVSASIMTCLSE